MPDEPLWTASDVAEFLSISERTVRAWQLDHKLPYLKIGGTVRFIPEEIRTWASFHEVRSRLGP
ncbi:MAG TPA: helix-turn-helix domain-containing protein [Acidimicrobiales bacterium]|nr:helix-turn-helix domain-containing protein [Acidimicrobiales bacterium]